MQQLTGPGCLPPNLAGVQQLRTLPDSPSVQSPLAQRIREDIQISENEVDSPERESLRSQTFPEKSPHPSLPYVRGFPPPAPLVFTPSQIKAVEEVESVENVEVEKVVDTAKEQESDEEQESVGEKESVEENEKKEKMSLEERLRIEERIRLLEEALRLHKLEKDKNKSPECRNCGEAFAADHQC